MKATKLAIRKWAVGFGLAAGLAWGSTAQAQLAVIPAMEGTVQSGGNASGLVAKVSSSGAKLAGYAACVIPQAGITLSPSVLSFGNVASGSSSSPQNLTLTNTGNKELILSSIIIDRGALDTASTYLVSEACGTLLPGTSCNLPVVFSASHPTALAVPATLRIFSNAPGSPHAVSLSGNVTVGPPPPAPNIVVAPATPLNLGNIVVGNNSGVSTVTVSNTGNAPLTISSISSTNGEFTPVAAGAPTCLGGSVTVAAGQFCQFGVRYSPSASGASSTTVQIFHNAAPSNTVTNVSASGFGVATAPTLEVLPNNLYWYIQAGTHEDQSVTLKNISVANVAISGVTVSGLGYTVKSENCLASSPLAPGASCTVDIRASFSASDGYSGTLSIANDTAVNPVVVPLYSDVYPKPPEWTYTPTSIDFGTFTVGVSPTTIQDIVVTNTSTTDNLTFTATALYGSNFIVHAPTSGTPCGSAVPPGGTCTIGVLFQAFSESFFDDYISIFESQYGHTQDVYVSGSGFVPGPRIASSPSSFSFGSKVLSSSTTQTFTITNTGQSIAYPTLEFYDIYISGDADFSIDSMTCSITLAARNDPAPDAKRGLAKAIAPTNTCDITVKFTPSALGFKGASLYINSNALNQGETGFNINLDGFGTSAPQPSVETLPTSLSFTAQPLCSTSTGKAISLANTGAAPLNIISIVSSGEFLSSSDCPVSLAPGSCCTVGINYVPTVGGTGTGTLTVTHDAPSGPTVIPLSGTTDGALVCVNPAQVTFPDTRVGTASANQSLTISNPSTTGPVTISGVTASADFKNALPTGPSAAAVAPHCVGTLAPSGTCNLQVGFAPTSGPGAKTGTVMISTTAGLPKAVPVSGNATPATAPGVSLSGTSVQFGGQVINTESAAQVLSLTSSGTQVLNITGITVTGPFRVESKCPDAVSVADGCPLNLFFKPPALGPHTGTLTITTNASNSPHVVRLAGEGVPVPAPILVLSSTSLSFGTVLVGTNSPVQTFSISNRGNAPLLIGAITASNGFILGNSCPASLGAGGSCSVNVLFRAFGIGTQLGTVTINSNDASSPHSVSLNGKSCPITSPRAARLGLGAC